MLNNLLGNLFNFNNKLTFGVDISDSAIKVTALAKEGSSYSITAYSKVSLPKNAVIEKEVKDPAIVSAQLKEAIGLTHTSIKQAAIALPDSLVMTKIITVDSQLKGNDFEEQVIFEAGKHVPYPLEELKMDYYPLPNSSAQNPDQQSVFFAAARSEIVDVYIKILEDAGLTAKLIDVESFVIRKACLKLVEDFKRDSTMAVVDIGAVRTTLHIYDQDLPVFNRVELIGEEFLLKDIPPEKINLQDYANAPEKAIYEDFKMNLLQHIKRALQFYSSTGDAKPITGMILAGEVARMQGLDEFFNKEFNLPVHVADPLQKLKINRKVNSALVQQDSPGLLISLGLSLRSFD